MIEQKFELRKAKEEMIHADQPRPEPDATDRAETHARHDDREGELEIVRADLTVAEAARFEHRDLLALERDLAAHHGIRHERRDTQKHQRERDREPLQHADLIVDAPVRRMIDAAVGAPSPIGRQHPVDGRNHVAL